MALPPAGQRVAHQFHSDDELAGDLPGTEDEHAVRMIEGCSQTAFTLKTLAVDVAPALGREHLERHTPAGLDFLGLVDHAHPALAKQCHGAIRAEDAAWRQRVWPAIRRVGAFARLIGQGQRFEAGSDRPASSRDASAAPSV